MDAADIPSRFFLARFGVEPPLPIRFQLAVPLGCEAVRVDPPSKGAAEPSLLLARFRAASRPGIDIDVSMTVLPREIHTGDFAELLATASGDKVVQRRDWEHTQGCQAELFAEFERLGEKWVRRSRVVKDGQYVFCVDAMAPKPAFAKFAKDCAHSVMSFRLLSAENRPYAEGLKELSGDSPCRFSFRYPETWKLARTAFDSHRAVFALNNSQRDTLDGTLTLEIHQRRPDYPLARYARAYATSLRDAGFRLNGAPVLSTSSPAGFDAAYVFTPPTTKDGLEVTAGAVLMEQGTAVTILGIVGASRESSPWAWAINKRAFEIVRDSLVLGAPVPAPDSCLTLTTRSAPSFPTTEPSAPTVAPGARKKPLDAGSY